MATFPDWLYRFTPRDEQITSIELVNLISPTSTFFITSYDFGSAAGYYYTVPADRVMFITGCHMHLTASAGTTLDKEIYATGGGFDDRTLIFQSGNPDENYNFSCGQILTGGTVISCRMAVQGGATGTGWFNVSGILMPRGNIAV